MTLLVSIHDVTPALAEPTLALWNLCRRYGATPALLVVPDWHGNWPLRAHPRFAEWLRNCEAQGAEILLHGERHDEVGVPRSVLDHLRAFGRTKAEGEFLTLNQRQAAIRINRGMQVLRSAGLSPVGFVPPAWLARDDTFAAARDAGCRLGEDSSGIRLLTRTLHIRAPAVRWSGRTPMRARLSAFVASSRWHLQRRCPLVRLALHPQDLEHPSSANSVYREVPRWIGAGLVGRYADL